MAVWGGGPVPTATESARIHTTSKRRVGEEVSWLLAPSTVRLAGELTLTEPHLTEGDTPLQCCTPAAWHRHRSGVGTLRLLHAIVSTRRCRARRDRGSRH